MVTKNYLRRVLLIAMWAMWLPGLAMAAVLDYESALASIGWLAASVNAAIALLSGLTALLQTIRRELATREAGRLPNPWVFCAANLTGSLLAGLLGFGVSRWGGHASVWLELVTVAGFAFVGARAVEAVTERVIGTYFPGAGRVRLDAEREYGPRRRQTWRDAPPAPPEDRDDGGDIDARLARMRSPDEHP